MKLFLTLKHEFVFPDRVVTESCYPYKSGFTGLKNKCKLPRSIMRPSATSCPGTAGVKSPVYQVTPPYRIAPHVSFVHTRTHTHTHTHTYIYIYIYTHTHIYIYIYIYIYIPHVRAREHNIKLI